MKTLSTLILFISAFQLTAQNEEIEQLRSAYLELEKDDTQSNQREFFELFPNSFDSFNKTFGFSNDKFAPLYDGREYILKFFSLDSIPKGDQIKKWVNISIDGHWEADAVNYFQHELRQQVDKNIDLTYQILQEKNSNEIESFFYFLFQDIHPSHKTVPNDFDRFKNTDEEFYKLIVIAHDRAIQDSGH